MSKFLKTYNLLRLNYEELENLNRIVTTMEIESIAKKHPTKNILGPGGFTGEFYQKFKAISIAIFLKLFQRTEKEKNFKLIL